MSKPEKSEGLKGAARLAAQRPQPVSADTLAQVATILPAAPPPVVEAPAAPPKRQPTRPSGRPQRPAPAGTGLAGTLSDFTLPAAPREKTVPVNLSWLPSFRDRLDAFCAGLGNGWNRSNLTQYVMTEIMDRLEAAEAAEKAKEG